MIQICNKKSCAGCTACMAACPKDAISMVVDEQGFLYPTVITDKCVNCGVCDRVCPFGKSLGKENEILAFAVKHRDAMVLQDSTSGGIFTAISDYVLSRSGVVYGAILDENIVVRHVRATTTQERDRMRGSKYVQSDLCDIFQRIKIDLGEGKLVLFAGTPCQVAGLRSYLDDKCDGLICLDLICHGVPSPLIYAEHIRFLSRKLRTEIRGYQFRPKKWGWHIHREVVQGRKRTYHATPYTDLWRDLYYSRIVTRPSCNNCPYSNLHRYGDISIGDCRGIDKVLPDFGSYEGVSLAIVNTNNGREVFMKIADDVVFEQLNIADVMQPPLKQSSKPNQHSEQFFDCYRKYGYEKAIVKRFGRLYPLKYYIKKFLRKI